MAIIKLNNQSISAVSALPAGVSGLDFLGNTSITSGVSTVDITLDTTNYGMFKFMLNAILPVTDTDYLRMRYSTDGGSSFAEGGTDYDYTSWEQQNAGSFSSNIDNDTTNFPMNHGETPLGTSGNERSSYEITLWNNQLYPKVLCLGAHRNSSSNAAQWFRTAVFMTTSTVNAVRFYLSTGSATFSGGSIDTYGFSK